MAKKITQYPASGGNPEVGSLIDISELISGVYTSKKLTFQQLLDYLTANLVFGSGVQMRNNTGTTILKGTPVELGSFFNSTTANLKRITSSDSINKGKIYIAEADILNSAIGNCIESGIIQFPSSFTTGDNIFWNTITQTFTNDSNLDDNIFIGIILLGNILSSGRMIVSPHYSKQLVKGLPNQVPLFTSARVVGGNSHFTWIDTVGTEVGFTFDDGANNITKVGVTYINVESEGLASNSVLRLANWSNNTNKGIVSFRKSRGTKAVPLQVLNDDVLGTLIFSGQTIKTINSASPTSSGMTTGEIIIRAMQNFSKNYNVFLDETTANGLTQYEIYLQPTNGNAVGDFTPLNIKVFTVNGDGKVSFKNYNFPILAGTNGQTLVTDGSGNLTWQTPSGTNIFNSNGTITANRTVTLANLNLILSGIGINGSTYLSRSNGAPNPTISVINLLYNSLQLSNTDGFSGSSVLLQSNQITNTVYDNDSNSTSIEQTAGQIKLLVTDAINATTNQFVITANGFLFNTYTFPKTDGGSGTSLITDGAGNVAWGVPSASASTSMQTIGRNSTGSTLYKGTVVYISGSTGNRPNFIKARADIEATSAGTFGVVISNIANNSDGYVCTIGTISGLDTRSVATNPFTTDTLVDGDTIYLSPTTAGYITNVKPSAPNHLVYLGKVVQTSPTNGTIVYRIQNGYELEELHNVAISGLANNDVLQYESATQLWKNKPISLTPTTDIWRLSPTELFRGFSFNNNSTTVTVSGGIVASTSASTLAKSVSSTNLITKNIGLFYYASVVSTGRYTGTRGTALLWFLGGGFRFVGSFSITDTVYNAGCRQFYGLQGSIADLTFTDTILVASLQNCIGVGSDALDANLQIFTNDATGTCTKIDLGSGFPANRTAGVSQTTIYEVQFYNPPAQNVVYYRVENKETGALATGILSTDLPATTQGLNFFASRCMGTALTNSGQFALTGQYGVYSTN